MRSPTPAALSRLRSTITSDTTAPLHRTRPRPTACVFCTHRASSETLSRRQQSTSTAQATNKEDTNPPPQTHYTFFPKSLPAGPPPHGRFAVDLSALKKEFLQLQARAHPDLHPPSNKTKAQALSARINEAYKTLQSPLLRAQYLLSLRGIELAEDETAKVEDPELLMEVLETREQIEEAESEEDLLGMKSVNEQRIKESVKVLEDAFEKEDMDRAKEESVRLRYWVNVRDSLDAWEKGQPVVLVH